jgi:hypothetical protein
VFDDFLDIASGYDLITPLASFFQDIINGPHCYFGIPSMAGWTKREIGRILARHGVAVWGLMYDGDIFFFTVRQDQARWAHYVLTSKGVPVLFPRAEAIRPPARQSPHGKDITTPMDNLFSFLDRLFGGGQ